MTQCFRCLIQIMLRFRQRFFFFFLCGGIERDKVKHTGIADKGDEATIGKCRIKTVLGKGSSV